MVEIIGVKAFDSELCGYNHFQYEVGKTYTMDDDPIPCIQGFHFGIAVDDLCNIYTIDEDSRFCKVCATGDIKNNGIIFVTNKITIIEEVTEDVRTYGNVFINTRGRFNTGKHNSGNFNTGDNNSGNRNTGDNNKGDWNAGYNNIGSCNVGSKNIGDYNIGGANVGFHNLGENNQGNANLGDKNIGDYNWGTGNIGWFNSGNCNTGDGNIGDWNHTTGAYGFFNTETKNLVYVFDKPLNMSLVQFQIFYKHTLDVLQNMPYLEQEVKFWGENASSYTYYTKEQSIEARQRWWNNLTLDDKRQIVNLPNFDADIFYKCTYIDTKKGWEYTCE